jgi:(p)ppGpp synthase/HD superfamily hydrolase
MDRLPIFSPLVEHAIEVAAQWHEQTYRKSTWRTDPFEVEAGEALRVPVAAHVTNVAVIVQRGGWEDEVVAAAFLHDIIEDANRHRMRFSVDRLRELIGEAVTAIVLEVTEPKFDDDGKPMRWRARKDVYLDGLRRASAGAVAISLADKLHNLWTMNEALAAGTDIFVATDDRVALSAGPMEQRWFQGEVLDASSHVSDPRLEPLRARFREEIARFDELMRGR